MGKDVADAFRIDGSTSAVESGDAWGAGVVVKDRLPEGLWIRPDQSIQMRQSIAPLNRTITAYGELVPTTSQIVAENVTLAGSTIAEPLWSEDYFAPAQFDRLGDSASLSSPSYELMTAGVRFGDDRVAISQNASFECTAVSREPETSIFEQRKPRISRYVSPPRRSTGMPIRKAVSGPKLKLRKTSYTLLRTEDGRRAGDALSDAGLGLNLSYADAVRVLEQRALADPLERTRLRVAPSYAVTK